MSFLGKIVGFLSPSRTFPIIIKAWPLVRKVAKTSGLDVYDLIDALYLILPKRLKVTVQKDELLPAAEALLAAYKKLSALFKK